MATTREFMTDWEPGKMTSMQAWSQRENASLRGTATGKRYLPKLRPFDMIAAPHEPVALLSNHDMRVSVMSAAGPAPYFHRNINFDQAFFQFSGTATIEAEMGTYELAPGEMLVIPRGISHRTIGTADALAQVVHMRSPITETLDEEQCTSRTRFAVTRSGGPDFSRAAAGKPAGPDVIEKMFVWDEDPADAVHVRRNVADLVGVTSTKRDEKVSAIKKLRPFDLFTDISGRKGPGPKFLSSDHAIMEVYNTIGEQFAFHRALESEEFGLQFMGACDNMSEFEDTLPMTPGDWFLIPLGIAHSVKECKSDFRRMVIYSKSTFKTHATPAMHAYESTFAVQETVIEEAPWHAEARAAAATPA